MSTLFELLEPHIPAVDPATGNRLTLYTTREEAFKMHLALIRRYAAHSVPSIEGDPEVVMNHLLPEGADLACIGVYSPDGEPQTFHILEQVAPGVVTWRWLIGRWGKTSIITYALWKVGIHTLRAVVPAKYIKRNQRLGYTVVGQSDQGYWMERKLDSEPSRSPLGWANEAR